MPRDGQRHTATPSTPVAGNGEHAAPHVAATAAANGTNGTGQPAQIRLQVPERPRLAPGIRPAGQMQESAFEDPPWLLEREGEGYVQVTELLHRIAEQCDGRRTLAEIADEVSRATGRGVSADNVKELVGKQLLLKGLVTTADGKVVSGGEKGSLLALAGRTRVVGAEAIEPFARVFQLLFWPPVLIAVLVAAGLAQAWLYFVHGVAGGVHDAIQAPALLAFVLVMTALSAAFHEFGHAAALRYGGGRAKSMGFGLYMIYPAFYTDVSDNYRLPRWSRVRTDLGGFYFNLIVALAVMGVYALTGQEFLLLVVVLLNLEIVRQLLPLLRLDGYWVLADVTGVPDFYTRIGAFVRRLRKRSDDAEPNLPRLKWWGRVVLALYMLTAIPAMLFLLLMMVKGAPRVLATVWQSAERQAQSAGQGFAAGNGLDVLGGVLQLLLLALPALGILYSLYRIGSRLVVGLWNWSKPTPQRRALGGLAALAMMGVLYVLWGPALPGFLPGVGDQPGLLRSPGVFEPIRPDERGTIRDAVAGVVATREGRPSPSPEPSPTTEPAVGATAAPTVALTPSPASSATPPTSTPTLAPTLARTATTAPAPAVATSNPTPRATAPAPAVPTATPAPATATPVRGTLTPAAKPAIGGSPTPTSTPTAAR